jgi:hypothetical protein
VVTGDELRAVVLALPEAQERESWGHPTFRVRDKMFATMAADGSTASVKASKDDQAELIAVDPLTFRVAAYVGRYGWVDVVLGRVDQDEMRDLLVEAWRRTAPRRMVAEFDAGLTR